VPLPALFDITSSDASIEQFFFWNAQDHIEISQAVQAQKTVNLFQRVLHPVDMQAIDLWLELHQQSHNDINQVLGLSGNDLSDLDFSDPRKVREWMNLHAQEHLAMRQALKI
jgi:hypothetical protein